jgi:predicted nucleic acid-binding protein
VAYLLALDAAVAWFKNHRRLRPRAAQRKGELFFSALSVMPLIQSVLRPNAPAGSKNAYFTFLQTVTIVDVNEPIAYRAIMLERQLQRQGNRLRVFLSVVAATALERGLTVVTHDANYQLVPGLTTEDWTAP